MFFQLAWRNIWRNPRRTAVITLAVVIGVWSMVFLGALTRGMIADMIENGIATLTGDIQVHRKGYLNDPVIDYRMTDIAPVGKVLDRTLPPSARWSGRIRVPAVASNAYHSGGVTLVGIMPESEPAVSFIGPKAMAGGRFLTASEETGIVVGKALLDTYDTRVGHKLVLMSEDTGNEIASRAFRIIGAFRAEMESTEKQYVFVTIDAARSMLKADGALSEIAVALTDHDRAEPLAARLASRLPADLSVKDWKELLPLLTAYLSITEGFLLFWYLVIFVAMGIGVVNTLLMAVFERMREFGLMKALGMGPAWIVRSVLTESFFLLVIGTAIGNLLAFASVALLMRHGIDLSGLAAGAEYAGMPRVLYPALRAKDVLIADLVVFVLGTVVSLYPAVKAARIKPVEAMVYV